MLVPAFLYDRDLLPLPGNLLGMLARQGGPRRPRGGAGPQATVTRGARRRPGALEGGGGGGGGGGNDELATGDAADAQEDAWNDDTDEGTGDGAMGGGRRLLSSSAEIYRKGALKVANLFATCNRLAAAEEHKAKMARRMPSHEQVAATERIADLRTAIKSVNARFGGAHNVHQNPHALYGDADARYMLGPAPVRVIQHCPESSTDIDVVILVRDPISRAIRAIEHVRCHASAFSYVQNLS